MKHSTSLLRGLPASWSQRLRIPGTVLTLALGSLPLAAQDTPDSTAAAATDDDTVVLDEMVVNTVRGSLIGAQEIKQNSTQFVDSIVAEDIGKLPDNTVADALQRVPGIQVGRDNGEVNSVIIRGLPNLGTTLNGHEIYTGTGRGVALQDLPADLVAGVDVYKTNAPEQIDGGIAGLIDIRLRRPLDLEEGMQFAASGRYIHGENAEDDSWVGSALLSNRWELSGGGEFGALIAASYQNINFSDQRVFNFLWEPVSPVPPNSLPPGSGSNTALVLPVTAGSLLTPGDRKRPAFNASLQWKPGDSLEFYTDFLFTGYRNKHDVYFFIGFPRDGALFGTGQSVTLVEGSNAVDEISTSPANFQLTSTQAFDDNTDGYQWVGGVKWRGDRLQVSSEAVYNWNVIKNRVVIVDTQFVPPAGSTPTFNFDLNTPHGTNVSITGADITDPANFRFWGLFDNRNYAGSEQVAWKLDFDYTLDSGFFTRFKSGIRVSDRDVHSRASSRNDIAPAAGRGNQVITTVSGFGSPAPDGLFSEQQFGASNWAGGNADFQRNNPDVIRGIFGLPAGDPPFNPTQTFNDVEKTYAIYGQANYETEIGGKRTTGLLGVRVVKTDQRLEGFRTDFSRVDDEKDQVDVLPTLTARVELQENLLLRFGASRAVTRPNFADLNPVVSLTSGTTTNPIGTGSGGNPDLDTVTSDNFDISIENYFTRSSYVALVGFYRRIDGYVQSFASNETIDGSVYSVVRPRNSGSGHLNGFEVIYQHFFDNLPGALRGLGLQANYTYITGKNSVADTGEKQPYAQVSKHSYNLIGIYERGPFSARLAYNYRGKFVDTFNGPNAPDAFGTPLRVITVKPTDRVDFNMTYRINEHLTATFDIANLFDSKFQDYFGPDPRLYPRDTRMYDRTFELGMRYRF